MIFSHAGGATPPANREARDGSANPAHTYPTGRPGRDAPGRPADAAIATASHPARDGRPGRGRDEQRRR